MDVPRAFLKTWTKLGNSSTPKLVFVQPDGVRIAGDKFFDGQALDQHGTRNALLLAIDKDGHEPLSSLAARSLWAADRLLFAIAHSDFDAIHRDIAAAICQRA